MLYASPSTRGVAADDLEGRRGGAEPRVDVHDAHPWRAAVHHGKHGRHASEGSAVADAGLRFSAVLSRFGWGAVLTSRHRHKGANKKEEKGAPRRYSHLVGTAMTGAFVSPATTLGSAPSIPAHTTTAPRLSEARRGRLRTMRWRPATPQSWRTEVGMEECWRVTRASEAASR